MVGPRSAVYKLWSSGREKSSGAPLEARLARDVSRLPDAGDLTRCAEVMSYQTDNAPKDLYAVMVNSIM